MIRDIFMAAATILAGLFSLVLVVRAGAALGVAPADLYGPTFVFRPLTITLAALALLLPIMIVLASYHFYFRGAFAELGLCARPFYLGAAGFLLGVGALGLNYLLALWLRGGARGHWNIEAGVGWRTWLLYYGFYLSVLVLNSVSEELLFRAFPVWAARKFGFSAWGTLLVVSTAFSLVHFLTSEASLANFAFRTLYGALLCVVFMKTGSFWLIAGFHTGTNYLESTLADNWKMGGIWKLEWATGNAAAEYSFCWVLLALLVAALFVPPVGAWSRDQFTEHARAG